MTRITGITFFREDLRPAPMPSFLPGFVDTAEREAAADIVDWAKASGLLFRPSRGKHRLVEYVVVPDVAQARGARLPEPILTLQQANHTRGPWDIPFGRMNGLALGAVTAKRRLLDALNAVLPLEFQLDAKGLIPGNGGRAWSERPYTALLDPGVRSTICGVLARAADGAKAGTVEGYL